MRIRPGQEGPQAFNRHRIQIEMDMLPQDTWSQITIIFFSVGCLCQEILQLNLGKEVVILRSRQSLRLNP